MTWRNLTQTQRIILAAAAAAPTGRVGFYAGDRKGTRVARHDAAGTPWIIAYGRPEGFLKARGYLTRDGVNEPHVWRITDAGHAAHRAAGGPVR